MSNRLKVEFHCHSNYSQDSLNTLEGLLRSADQRGIDRVAITDHNTVEGALEAVRLAPERFIPGLELMTRVGELLAFFVKEDVPVLLEPLEAVRRLRDQGAFISVSHPFDLSRAGWPLDELLRLIPHVDAIEGFNARCLSPNLNKQAAAFAREHNLLTTAGSDAHTYWELGRAAMVLPAFSNAEGLRQALPQSKTELRLSPFWVHFGSRYASWRKKLSDNK
jgi:predicted metal-dependent phosphoesterase TrpH